MINKILILATLCGFCYGTDPKFRYDYKYYKRANGWLKLHYAPMRWEDARLQCYYEGTAPVPAEQTLQAAGVHKCSFPGATLASPLDQRLEVDIWTLLQDKKPCPYVVFSGVSASFADGIYASVEGVPLERMSINWSKDEPSLLDGCLVFFANGTMGTKSCKDYYPYICYKKHEELVINECGTVDNEYQRFDNESTKCYKYHSKRVNWPTAYKICMAEGAYLTTTLEYDTKLRRKQEMNTVSVGLKHLDGTWWDIHGKQILQDHDETNLSFGGRAWNGNLVTMDYNQKNPFICEKTIDSLFEPVYSSSHFILPDPEDEYLAQRPRVRVDRTNV